MFSRTWPVDPSLVISWLEKLGGVVAGLQILFRLIKMASRVKAKHVIGGVAIGAGEAGVGMSGTFLYVWNLLIVPPNLGIASRSPLSSAVMTYSMLVEVDLMFSLVGFLSLTLVANGVVKFSSDSWPARGFRKIPLVRRFVLKSKRPDKAASNVPSYIQAC